MYSSNNSSWSSSIYAQDAGDTNWYQYTLSIVGTPKKYTINTQNTTASSLSTYNGYDLSSGQNLILSTDGSTWTNAALGVASTVSPLFPTPQLSAELSSDSNTIFANTGTAYGNPVYVKPDGSAMWKINSTTLVEYQLSNSWNLSTATLTGKAIGSFSVANSSPSAFTFSNNGKYLFKVSAGYVYQYVLSTPWDISTTSANAISVTADTLANESGSALPSYGRYLKISPDGTKLFYLYNLPSGTSHGYVYTIQIPWVIGTTTLTATSNTGRLAVGVGTTATVGGANLSDDGKTLIVLRNDGTVGNPISNIAVWSLSTPWNVATKSTVGSSYNLSTSNYNFIDPPQSASMFMVVKPDGQQITTSWGALNNFQTFTTKTNTEYNFNISSHGLGAAPAYAYRPMPNAYVQVANTSSYISLAPKGIATINANATIAFVSANSSNLILASSDILVNGTTSVAVTNVIQGANNAIRGYRISTGSAFLRYKGKNWGLPHNWTRSNIYTFKLSPDGSKIYLVGNNSVLFPSTGLGGYPLSYGVAQYTLTTPFDISTAVLSGTFRPKLSLDTYVIAGADFDPTGVYMTLCYSVSGTATVSFKEFVLSTAWDIETASYNGTYDKTAGTYGINALRGKFAPDGLSYFITQYYSDGYQTHYTLYYCTTSVPFRILNGTSSSFTSAINDTSSNYSFLTEVQNTWSPNGLAFIAAGKSNRPAEHTNSISSPFTYSGLTATGSNTMYTVTQSSGTEGAINWPISIGGGNTGCYGVEFSADGQYLYALNGSDNYIFQFDTNAANTTQYEITYTAQSGYPNTFSIPDRTIPVSLTPTLFANGTVLLTSANVANNGRVIATRLDSAYEGTSVDSLTINLWKV